MPPLLLLALVAQPYEHFQLDAADRPVAGHVAECNRCHQLDPARRYEPTAPVGAKPEAHAVCSAEGCHARDLQDGLMRWAKSRRWGEGRFCATCHTAKKGEFWHKQLDAAGRRQFGLMSFHHTTHLELEAACATCHPGYAKKERARSKHTACGNAACHGETTSPPMADCIGCHVAVDGRGPPLASKSSDPFRAGSFSHLAHARVASGTACTACHVERTTSKGQRVGLPGKPACKTCHQDGKKAFGVYTTRCFACHVRPGSEP